VRSYTLKKGSLKKETCWRNEPCISASSPRTLKTEMAISRIPGDRSVVTKCSNLLLTQALAAQGRDLAKRRAWRVLGMRSLMFGADRLPESGLSTPFGVQ